MPFPKNTYFPVCLLVNLRAAQRDKICLALILFPLGTLYWPTYDAFLITLTLHEVWFIYFIQILASKIPVSEHLEWLKFPEIFWGFHPKTPTSSAYSNPSRAPVHCTLPTACQLIFNKNAYPAGPNNLHTWLWVCTQCVHKEVFACTKLHAHKSIKTPLGSTAML